MSNLKKGDLARFRFGAKPKALVIDGPRPDDAEVQSVRVLWLSGADEGKATWEGPDWLRKVEVESDQTQKR